MPERRGRGSEFGLKVCDAELFQPILDQSEICVNVLACGAGRGLEQFALKVSHIFKRLLVS
ncbi:hypothetical protein XI09_12320 [Bradyrhizobium sp. CCBAU 11386]|uniref:hypothetical protein n=1 Tax=Bradyrhizobium sp. CCBAU 11386 TaxID=1630837 RepID=UPI00230488CC|nr:hypothetical protein [Bradyrhizobium sp. CCBAU 11386]MDA9505444.1 hypothetical protein [Bradyrhizobium sp. CCBAU 11386]